MKFCHADLHRLRAADGWLDLGNWQEANDELENVTSEMRAHPFVLQMRSRVYLEAKDWDLALTVSETLVQLTPDDGQGWIHRSFALRELGRTGEAEQLLLPALAKFPHEPTIRYNLACYACKLGRLENARELLRIALAMKGGGGFKQMALDDPDLAGLWTKEQ